MTCVQLDSPKQNRKGQDFSYTVLHEVTVNFDSNSCQLWKFALVDFDSSQRSSVTLVPEPNTLSVTISDPHPSTVTLRIVFVTLSRENAVRAQTDKPRNPAFSPSRVR